MLARVLATTPACTLQLSLGSWLVPPSAAGLQTVHKPPCLKLVQVQSTVVSLSDPLRQIGCGLPAPHLTVPELVVSVSQQVKLCPTVQ